MSEKCACGHVEHVPVSPPKSPRCPHPRCGHGRYLALDAQRPCRPASGKPDRDGYVRVSHGRTAHQRAFEEEVRDLLPGETLDHICRNRLCEATWHLDPVTQSVNSKRRWGQHL